MSALSDRLGRVTSTGIVYGVLVVAIVVGAILTAATAATSSAPATSRRS